MEKVKLPEYSEVQLSEEMYRLFKNARFHRKENQTITAFLSHAELYSVNPFGTGFAFLVTEREKDFITISITYDPDTCYWENTKRDGTDPWKGVKFGRPTPWANDHR